MRTIKHILFAACLVGLLTSVSAFANGKPKKTTPVPEVINVWDGPIPGSKVAEGYAEKTVYVGENNTKPRVSQVTNPTLTLYRPTGENKHVAIIICPGGGYGRLSMDSEGTMVAEALAKKGYTAFVLKYRLPSDLIMEQRWFGPLSDAQRSIRLIRSRAAEFDVHADKIGIMGFSAGGNLAAHASTLYNVKAYDPGTDTISARPDFSILCYPVISMRPGLTHLVTRENLIGGAPNIEELEGLFSADENVTYDTPPAFLVHSADDWSVSCLNSMQYATAMTAKRKTPEVHIFRYGSHGFGLADTLRSVAWLDLADSWLGEVCAEIDYMKSKPALPDVPWRERQQWHKK